MKCILYEKENTQEISLNTSSLNTHSLNTPSLNTPSLNTPKEISYKVSYRVSYDIIYNIYFYINDYCTVSNFWLLSKDFNIFMKKYNKAYKHKFMLLFNDIFTFLSSLPYSLCSSLNNTYCDIDFFELITVQTANNIDKKMLRNDIYFLYRVIKNFFIYYLTSNHIDNFNKYPYFNLLKNISYASMLQGSQFLLDNINIKFNKNYVMITNKYNKNVFLEKLINLKNYNVNYDKLCLQVKMLYKYDKNFTI